jgi:hypothetical protein
MNDLSDITIWVAVLAIATALQTLMLIGMGIVTWRTSRKLQDVATRVERDHVVPLITRANEAVSDVRAIVGRVEREHVVPLVARVNDAVGDLRDVASRVRALDDGVKDTVATATERARDVADVVMQRAWPAYAVGRAAYAMVSALMRGNRAGARG